MKKSNVEKELSFKQNKHKLQDAVKGILKEIPLSSRYSKQQSSRNYGADYHGHHRQEPEATSNRVASQSESRRHAEEGRQAQAQSNNFGQAASDAQFAYGGGGSRPSSFPPNNNSPRRSEVADYPSRMGS